MPKTYSQDTVDDCRKFYCQFGGNGDQIQTAMRREYPGWTKGNLYDKGKDGNFREGWISKYGFDKSLQEYLKVQVEGVTGNVEKLYLSIKAARERLDDKMTSGNYTRDEMFGLRDFQKLEMEALQKLDISTDNFEGFVSFWEKLLEWLPDISATATAAFLDGTVADQLLEKARDHYGEQETNAQS